MRPPAEHIFRCKALLILIVFGISLLPRQVLHNFVTNHKHTKYAGYPGKAQFSAETFNCSTDTIFLQQNYHTTARWQPLSLTTETAQYPSGLFSGGQSIASLQRTLRGPPSLV